MHGRSVADDLDPSQQDTVNILVANPSALSHGEQGRDRCPV